MKRSYSTLFTFLLPFCCFAINIQKDSIDDQVLDEIVVEAKLQKTSAQVSTYLPTTAQKNAAQTGTDLINRMAIPQLRISADEKIETTSGKAVSIYIDYAPASAQDLKGMNMNDVKKVEYYTNPTDIRFQGDSEVINFVMHKYLYGGYIENETYRLPQEDGTIKIFDRITDTSNSKQKNHSYWAGAKFDFNTDKIRIYNIISSDFDYTPHADYNGNVDYTPAEYPSSKYSSTKRNTIKSFVYSGYYYFMLSKNNSLTLNPFYSYTDNLQNTSYTENTFQTIINDATDYANQFKTNLSFSHSFGSNGTLTTFGRYNYLSNRTHYTGTTIANDKSNISRYGIGATYSINRDKFYTKFGAGYDWDKSDFTDIKENNSAPWFDFSFQYSPNSKNSANVTFHYSTWAASSSYKSTNIIQSNHLLSYTGNPALTPEKSYDISANYTFIPSNKYNFSAYSNIWIVQNRYVFDYMANSEGILRTIQQPMGNFGQYEWGLYGSTKIFDRKLQISAILSQKYIHNSMPYDIDKLYVNYSLQAAYYLNKFNFGGAFISKSLSTERCNSGVLIRRKNSYYVYAGWSNSNLNIRLFIKNFARWNWIDKTYSMNSLCYDTHTTTYSTNSHAMLQISATYTFGYGKKIERENDPSRMTGASSGILK